MPAMDSAHTKPYHIPSNAVWFITGCSSGIGLALAQLVASKAPYRLVATARKISSLATIPDSDNVLKLDLDVTSQSSVETAIAAALAKFGRLDIIVNNAGYSLAGDTENAMDEQEQREIETLFWGPVRITKHAMRIMREENPKTGQQGGVVLNVTSMGGFSGYPGTAFYHAGKFAVEGFTESVAKEVSSNGTVSYLPRIMNDPVSHSQVHFCLIEPGGVQTNYATSSPDHIKPHPAYAAPDTPTRILEAYIADPEARETWALPEAVAGAMEEVVSRGQRIPIRVPLGPDAWGVIKMEVEKIGRELDELRSLVTDLATRTSSMQIDFLNK